MTDTITASTGPTATQPRSSHAGAPLWRPIWLSTQSGLILAGRHYAARPSAASVGAGPMRRAVLCLAGLTRNARDFDRVASALCTGPTARDVYALDMRGRGQSDWDSDPRNYAVLTELFDVQDFLTAFDLHDVAIIGTSRGGLIAMGLGATQPTRFGAIILNDIGPVIEREGLLRISGYVGQSRKPANWAEAAADCRRIAGRDFPKLTDHDWDAFARQLFNEKDGRPVAGYDPAIAKAFESSAQGIPPLWAQFKAICHVPCLTIRGALSDLLSERTVQEMAAVHPDFRAMEVPDQGHAPLLWGTREIDAIAAFLADTDPGA